MPNTIYKYLALHFCIILSISGLGQNYSSYFTGSANDMATNPLGGICMMGGATEDDEAMKWFLLRANGGDVLVLRASGSDGYNNYLYAELGIVVNSVETIVFNDVTANAEPYIHERIQKAEAIWFAGGDQWDYVRYWRNSAIDSLINDAITNRNIVIGGTSAGMAVQGGFYFSAQNGTVTSTTALANPYNVNITVDSASFIKNQYLEDVITDTHYDDPNRKGRHLVFLSRILTNYEILPKGIACDEYTAVCIDPDGIAHVYGKHPAEDDNAYFIQTNCELADVTPEDCLPGIPLDWDLGKQAIKVYKVKGTSSGTNTFDLKDWATGEGGNWETWYVDNGSLMEEAGTAPDCLPSSIDIAEQSHQFQLFPNPASDLVHVNIDKSIDAKRSIHIFDVYGREIKKIHLISSSDLSIDISGLSTGIYFLQLNTTEKKNYYASLIVD